MKKPKITAIDLFAGIGGMRLGFEKVGFEIVYSNDVDKYACETYRENFGEIDEKDIRLVDPVSLPAFVVGLNDIIEVCGHINITREAEEGLGSYAKDWHTQQLIPTIQFEFYCYLPNLYKKSLAY